MAQQQKKGFFQSWGMLETVLMAVIVLLCLGAAGLGALTLNGYEFIIATGNPTPAAAGPAAAPTLAGGGTSNAIITVNPAAGSPGATVAIQGQGYPANSRVVISLIPKDPPNFALNSAIADANGQFSAEIIVPSDSRWLDESPVPVLAEAVDTGVKAQALLTIISPANNAAVTPVAGGVVEVSVADATPQPPLPAQVAQIAATANVNVRSGPGTNYAILGVLLQSQTAEITGRNADATWWQIKFSGAKDGRGWISAAYASAANISNVPIVNAPAPPIAPAATTTPAPGVNITEWRGEYWANKDLSGPAALVRNDSNINFDWGLGSPDAKIPADGFSARWTRTLNFTAGTYRFYARSDDGVRLYIDGALLIDKWINQSATTYAADVYLSEGNHEIRMEYFDEAQGAVAILSWERVDYTDNWRAEYYNNRDLSGQPALVRNEAALNYNWGASSPAPGVVNTDGFSARWTRQMYFENGDYTFRVRSDDGVRIWVDNNLVFDNWRDGDSNWLEARRSIPAGNRTLRVEYYERSGNAFISFSWARSDTQPTAPTAVIKSPSEAMVGQSIRFDGSRSRAGNYKIVSYDWDFGDGKESDDKRVDYTYSSEGTYKVKLKVTDEIGNTDTTQIRIKITKDPSDTTPPVAVINAPSTGTVNVAVRFDGSRSSSLKPIVRYDWDFGDGVRASGPTQDHTYTKTGLYDVTLTVVAENGRRDSQNVSIRIDQAIGPAELPVAIISAPGSGQVGQAITFDGTQSTAGTGSVLTDYKWDFGDGSVANATKAEHTYAAAGTYNIKLQVINNKGLSNSANQSLNVVAQPPPNPQPEILVNTGDPTVGEKVEFAANVIPTGSYQYTWDFGDGATDTATGQTVNHVYSAAGGFNVKLVVKNQQSGATGNTAKDITVKTVPPAPQPQIEGPATVTVGETATFTGKDGRDPANTTPIQDYVWDFGSAQQPRAADSSPQVTVNVSFDQAGTYVVKLTMIDTLGQQGSATKNVTVQDKTTPPTGATPPTARLSGPDTAKTGEQVEFNANNSVMGANQITGIVWDFGDGTTDATGVIAVAHTYQAAGDYQVKLTLTDSQGLTGTDTKSIQVTDASQTNPAQPVTGNAPTAVFNFSPTNPVVGQAVNFDGGFSSGDNPITDWQWQFGDGSTGSGMGAAHTYSTAGSYEVILTVTDDQGQTNTSPPVSVNVTEATSPQPQPAAATPTPVAMVADTPTPVPVVDTPTAAPLPDTPTPIPVSANPPVAGFSFNPGSPEVGQSVSFDGGFSSGDSAIQDYRWDFGDGQSGQGMGVQHAFAAPGQYQVTLTVVDSAGQSSAPSAQQVVVASQPTPEPTATPIPAPAPKPAEQPAQEQPTPTPQPVQPTPTPQPVQPDQSVPTPPAQNQEAPTEQTQ